MNDREALEWIHSLLRFGVKPGLERVRAVCERLGSPQKRLRFVHVAGTNGKGSVCAMLSEILQSAGYRTGMYTSPYLTDFCERMQVNGVPIPHDELARQADRVRPVIEEVSAQGEPVTEFEAVTALALNWFAEENCDVVVLEVGLGGRFDATNLIDTPLCSVITKIGLDHTDILGGTLTEIAFEKCGILKSGGAAVTYPAQEDEALAEIMRRAAQEGIPLYMGNIHRVEELESSVASSRIRYGELTLDIPLAGKHQQYNAVTAVETARVLNTRGLCVSEENIVEGIGRTKWPARMELISEKPLILLDGAHNPDGMGALSRAVDDHLAGKRIVAVIGMLRDKAVREALSLIAPRVSRILAVSPDNPRALSAEGLCEIASEFCENCVSFDYAPDAIDAALADCGEEDVLLVCGSLYLAGAIRPYLLSAAKFPQNN